jgi:hypothetical protein
MSTRPARERYLVTLGALPDATPAAVRLRALLKHALRRLRQRCLDAREAGAPAEATAAPGRPEEPTPCATTAPTGNE